MLTVIVRKEDLSTLDNPGVQVKINGEFVRLRRHNGWLLYYGEGRDNRCKILQEIPDQNGVFFVAASHGEEDEKHTIVSRE